MDIFADSSAFFALQDSESKEEEPLKKFILENHPSLVTTDFVFAESISLMTKRIGKYKGIDWGKDVFSSSVVRLIYLDEDLKREAWTLYCKFKDKDFDFIDATSFVFCKKNGIKEVLTLDRHFSQMGFHVRP